MKTHHGRDPDRDPDPDPDPDHDHDHDHDHDPDLSKPALLTATFIQPVSEPYKQDDKVIIGRGALISMSPRGLILAVK